MQQTPLAELQGKSLQCLFLMYAAISPQIDFRYLVALSTNYRWEYTCDLHGHVSFPPVINIHDIGGEEEAVLDQWQTPAQCLWIWHELNGISSSHVISICDKILQFCSPGSSWSWTSHFSQWTALLVHTNAILQFLVTTKYYAHVYAICD